MNGDELFTDVVYDNVDHRYEEKKEAIPVLSPNTYKVDEYKEPDINEVDNKEVIDERLRFLKKNILTEMEIGILFIILIFTSLMTLYEIFKIPLFKQILPMFFIAVVGIVIIYLIIVEYRIQKVKKSVKQ